MSNVVFVVAAAGVTVGRAQSLAALAVGLISVIVGGRSLARRDRGLAALVAGLFGMAWSAVRLANAGPVGSGGGRLGAIVALAVALIGTILGGLAWARSRRAS
jgi:hypothetical protein